MKLESPKVSIDKSAQEVFDYLTTIENFKTLMPENTSKFEVLDSDTFLFALSGMPEIVLKKKSMEPPHKIVLGAAGGKLDFSLTARIESSSASKSEVVLNFEGDFNPMMAMMIKGPITKFIETLAMNIPKSV
ncbi:SRPBCC family protein [Flavobacteriaceae bacterium]|jgi:carbon monoxide dehydrogenase subunit G|nr:SRPBCC family protein [Flavobacteriaceae bacterium]MDG1394539.1 SRPBCC family protein [Flavobacteriaceae bacterium]|tara:strand:+ start:285 stop:680 length:396 start_codon:yes stop_codon:yes gene_type:complete